MFVGKTAYISPLFPVIHLDVAELAKWRDSRLSDLLENAHTLSPAKFQILLIVFNLERGSKVTLSL